MCGVQIRGLSEQEPLNVVVIVKLKSLKVNTSHPGQPLQLSIYVLFITNLIHNII